MATATETLARPSATLSERFVRFWNKYLLFVYTGAAIIYLMAPVAVMILFSFNNPAGKSNFVWQGFTLAAWLDPFGVAGLQSAVLISVVIALLSTLVATALGTLIALALARHQFPGRSSTNLFIFLPMATPEIVLGASLLTLFVAIGAIGRKMNRLVELRPGTGAARARERASRAVATRQGMTTLMETAFCRPGHVEQVQPCVDREPLPHEVALAGRVVEAEES